MNRYDIKMLTETVGVPIRKLSVATMKKVNGAPQCQRVTAPRKKPVKIVGDFVFKGPYTDERDVRPFWNELRYPYALALLEEALNLDEWLRGTLHWEYVGCWNGNQYYFVAPNVGKDENIPVDSNLTDDMTNAPIINRKKHLDRVIDIEETNQLTDEIKLAALQHLYLRFLLDIGDAGTNNVLIREDIDKTNRLIAGIDLEDNISKKVKDRRSKAKSQHLDLLLSKPRKKHFRIYGSDTTKIKAFSYHEIDRPTLDQLSAVEIDLERLKMNTELW
jgi:hypothetical protein